MVVRSRTLALVISAFLLFVLLAACDIQAVVGPTPGPTNAAPGDSSGATQNPGGGLPNLAVKPQPQGGTYQGCPQNGDGGDHDLNLLKNRTDLSSWYPVNIAAIIGLSWP